MVEVSPRYNIWDACWFLLLTIPTKLELEKSLPNVTAVDKLRGDS